MSGEVVDIRQRNGKRILIWVFRVGLVALIVILSRTIFLWYRFESPIQFLGGVGLVCSLLALRVLESWRRAI